MSLTFLFLRRLHYEVLEHLWLLAHAITHARHTCKCLHVIAKLKCPLVHANVSRLWACQSITCPSIHCGVVWFNIWWVSPWIAFGSWLTPAVGSPHGEVGDAKISIFTWYSSCQDLQRPSFLVKSCILPMPRSSSAWSSSCQVQLFAPAKIWILLGSSFCQDLHLVRIVILKWWIYYRIAGKKSWSWVPQPFFKTQRNVLLRLFSSGESSTIWLELWVALGVGILDAYAFVYVVKDTME